MGDGGDRRRVANALHSDIALNFIAAAALCNNLLSQLQSQPQAAVVNITTGLVYLPKAAQPFYCAAKPRRRFTPIRKACAGRCGDLRCVCTKYL